METADPLNPSSKADAAEDLIEELARLMADDAQINTPTPAPVGAKVVSPGLTGQNAQNFAKSQYPTQTPAKSFVSGQEEKQGADQQNTSQRKSDEQGSGNPDTQGEQSQAGAENKPFIENFDLGQPQAEVSLIPKFDTDSLSQSTSEAAILQKTAQATTLQVEPKPVDAAVTDLSPVKDIAAQNSTMEKLDFDFGFGVGPEDAQTGGTAPINMPVKTSVSQTPNSDDADENSNLAFAEPVPDIGLQDFTAQQELTAQTAQDELESQKDNDPIAALINEAVTKHSTTDISAQMSAAELVSADLPLHNDTSNIQTSGTSKSDSFDTPPVFGMEGIKPTSRDNTFTSEPIDKPIGGSSALDDIEALIGNSVDVSSQSMMPEEDISAQVAVEGPSLATTSPITEHPAPASIAPMSGTPDAPVTDNKNPEASILDAMAGAGTVAAVGATHTKNATTASYDRLADGQAEPLLAAGRVKTHKSKKKSLPKNLVPMLGVLFLGVAGVAGYMYFNQPQQNADAPVLHADTTPARAEPAPVEAVERSVVLNEIDGANTPTQDEQLVSRDETDGDTGAVVRQVVTADNSESGLANRRVRTVTVRPDGTIVSGADTAAGSQVLPVEQPNLPDLPADAVNTILSDTTVAALPESASELAIQNPNLVTVNGDSVPFPRPALSNRAALRSAAIARETQLPQTTGVSTSAETDVVNLINDTTNSTIPATPVNVIPEASVATTPATTSVSNPQAYVQLASQRSQSVADQTARTMQSRFSSALNGGSLLVRRVDLGTRGIYYRVQLPTSTLSEANSICNAIKSAGGDCFTRNS